MHTFQQNQGYPPLRYPELCGTNTKYCHILFVSLTGVDGVMAARGILENPAMYAGAKTTPPSCISDWINIAMDIGTPFTTFHHHLIYMLEKSLSR